MIHNFLALAVIEQLLTLFDCLNTRGDGQEHADHDQYNSGNNCSADIQVHCLHYSIR